MKNSGQLQTIFLLTDKPIVSLKPKKLEDYPLNVELFGDLSFDEYKILKEDIKQRGIQDALHVVKRGKDYYVASGHQRKQIAIELGIDVPCIIRNDLKEDWQVEEHLISDNLLRRQLSDYQKVKAGERLEVIEKQRAKQRMLSGKKDPTINLREGDRHKREAKSKVAGKLGFSGSQYSKAKVVYTKATPKIKKQWKNNEITTHTAFIKTSKHKRKEERKKKQKEQESISVITNTTNDNIKNMDCIEFLKTIKSNSIDLILTDPPYKISKKTGFIKMSEEGVDRLGVSMDFGEWDKNFKDLDIVIDEFYRILKISGTVIIFYDLWKITKLAKMLTDAKFKQLRFIEWIKTNPVPLNSKLNYLTNSREIALTAVKNGNSTFNSEYDNGVYSYPIFQSGNRFHPTQKSVTLFEELIKKHSNKNDIVLDCFLGSGTTAIAAKNLKRNFKGCEISEKYYNLMIKRVENGK